MPIADRYHFSQIKKPDCCILNSFIRPDFSSNSIKLSDTIAQALRQILQLNVPVIAISFGSPYVFAQIPFVDVFLCAYDNNRITQEIVLEALTSDFLFQGRLPVTIPGHFERGSGLRSYR